MRSRKILSVLFLAGLALAQNLQAGTIRSPDVAHTYAFARVIDHELRWIPSGRALAASITFSNVDYMDRTEARRDERFDFFLPGVRFDSAHGVFYGPDGIPVATVRKDILGAGIHLAPGAKVYVTNRSGTVHVMVSTAREPRSGLRWVEIEKTNPLLNSFG